MYLMKWPQVVGVVANGISHEIRTVNFFDRSYQTLLSQKYM